MMTGDNEHIQAFRYDAAMDERGRKAMSARDEFPMFDGNGDGDQYGAMCDRIDTLTAENADLKAKLVGEAFFDAMRSRTELRSLRAAVARWKRTDDLADSDIIMPQADRISAVKAHYVEYMALRALVPAVCVCDNYTGSERNTAGEKVCERCGLPLDGGWEEQQ